jgi:LuxR family maltose regulon positive regulatory protein
LRSATLLLRAVVGREGVTSVRDDAAVAFDLDRPGSSWRTICRVLEGATLRLLGERELARARLQEGVRLSHGLMPSSEAQCLWQLALLAIDDGAWSQADARLEDARQLIDEHALAERPHMAGVYAAAALSRARRGATTDARADWRHAFWLLEMTRNIAPWLVAETMLLLARTSQLFGDVATARMLVREAEMVLQRNPDSGTLLEQLQKVDRTTTAAAVPVGLTATPLTPAEMRVLRYLPTHLSFGAIAGELFVSHSTVKTQAIAVYRKLGVSSRALAVAQANELGLLER